MKIQRKNDCIAKVTPHKVNKIHFAASDPALQVCLFILKQLSDSMRMNEAGIIVDLDVEFLHEFRIGLRKTRALLTQMRDLFPSPLTEKFLQEWAYWGRLTNRHRDLDVYLARQDVYRSLLPNKLKDGLQPIFGELQKERRREHAKVMRALNSVKFGQFNIAWGNFLQNQVVIQKKDKNAVKSIKTLVRKLLRKRSKKLFKLSGTIGSRLSTKALHRLRLQCKKLRYLMEFFDEIFPQKKIMLLLKQIKLLQDKLGEFNDLSNQCKELSKQEEFLRTRNKSGEMTQKAVKALIFSFAARQKVLRREIAATLLRFTSNKNREALSALFDNRKN